MVAKVEALVFCNILSFIVELRVQKYIGLKVATSASRFITEYLITTGLNVLLFYNILFP